MVMKAVSIGFAALLCATTALADTTAFDLTLGKTTESELKEKYPGVELLGVSSWTNGDFYSIPVSDMQFEGLKQINVLLDDNKKVAAIFATISNHRFKFVNTSLAQKYKLVKKQIPYVGDKYARYINGDDVIVLDSPHLSFEMKLTYIQKSTDDVINSEMKKADGKKKTTESSQL